MPTPLQEIAKQADKIIKKDKNLDWFGFSIGYLNLAALGCDHFLTIKEKRPSDYLPLIPIIFNIKHALEIILKYFYRMADEELERGHDLKELFYKVIEKCSKKLDKSQKGILKKNFFELESIILKYYHLVIIKKHIQDSGDFMLEDPCNTFLRYPEKSEAVFMPHFNRIIGRLTNDDAMEILVDINEIMKNLVAIREFYEEKDKQKVVKL